jgi:ribonuclease HI
MLYNIYTDGSYIDKTEFGPFYSSAATITKEGEAKPLAALTKVGNDDLLPMRNVAGEIIAVMLAMEHCLNVLNLKQDDEVVLHYDYVGIYNWCKKKGEKDYWRCKTPVTQAYRDYMNTIVRPRFKVTFVHTPGHKGIVGNELVDKMARTAINNHLENLRGERVNA